MSSLIVTTPPAHQVVSLAEVRLQLNIDTEDFDARFAGWRMAATRLAETYTGRAFITRAYRKFYNRWPAQWQDGMISRFIEVERPPLLSVQALTYYDDADNATVYPATNYYVDTARSVGRVVLRRGAVWPVALRVANAIQLDWTAGYGVNPSDVPEEIRQAIIIMIAWMNENRGDEFAPADMPAVARYLLDPYVTGLQATA
jgi:uncharacterized phiE125 gp8 family phage protein